MSWAALTLPAQCLEGLAPEDFEVIVDPLNSNDSMFVAAKKNLRSKIILYAGASVARATSADAFFDSLATALPAELQNLLAHEYAVLCYRSLMMSEDDQWGIQCKKIGKDADMHAKALATIAGDAVGVIEGTEDSPQVTAVTVALGPCGTNQFRSPWG